MDYFVHRRSCRVLIICIAIFSRIPHTHAGNDAQFLSINVPSLVYAGTPFKFTIEFRNTGTETWRGDAKNHYYLGSQNPRDNELWKKNRLRFSTTAVVKPQQVLRYTTYLLAPDETNTFNFQWRLIQSGHGWFGDFSRNQRIAVVPQVMLTGAELSVGYQGWFSSPFDKSRLNQWRHWFRRKPDGSIGEPVVDLWPDVFEYQTLYNTGLVLNSGQLSQVYSSYDQDTVDLHFQWMKQYGIRGAFVGRSGEPLGNAACGSELLPGVACTRRTAGKEFRDKIWGNALAASGKHGIKIAINYDHSNRIDSGTSANLLDVIHDDWCTQIREGATSQPNYLHVNGLPVFKIFGIGFNSTQNRAFSATDAMKFLEKFQTGQCRAFVIGGIPALWRSGAGNVRSDIHLGETVTWTDVFEQFDMLSPWTVNSYRHVNNDFRPVTRFVEKIVIPDLIFLNELLTKKRRRVGYLPVVWPGFSWGNLKQDPTKYNVVRRSHGRFLWMQVYEWLQAGSKQLFVAMFDEIDEGTAIYKVVNNKRLTPASHQFETKNRFLTYSENGTTLPTDWYLQLTKEVASVLDGGGLRRSLPITPINS